MKELLYDVIHYEGVGVFSAEDYRIKHQLPNHGSMIQEDYLVVSDEKIDKALRNDFRRLMNDLDKGSIQSSDEFLQRTFNKTKLPHRLGYRIFNEIHQKSGIQGVKKAIKMSDRDFANKYLKRI